MADHSGWIAPTLLCGLGNRLFQAMAAAGYAERTGRRLVFLLPCMSRGEHGCWKLFLQMFPQVPIIESAQSWKRITDLNEDPSGEEPIVTRGFFQDTAYWPSGEALWPVLPCRSEQSDFYAWAIHFRFGDYEILPHHQLSLGRYYRYLLDTLPKSTKLILFSDSPDRLVSIQKEIKDLGWMNVDISCAKGEEETLQEFMSCKGGAICSNSTFAWWAAWFTWRSKSKGIRYTAYFPTPWVKNQAPPQIFNLPFTHTIEIASIPQGPLLHSFPFH